MSGMTTVADGSYRARLLGLLGETNPLESLESAAGHDLNHLAQLERL